MESYLPQWVVDFSVLCSIAGLIWTAVVWLETRKIRHEFLVRIRLPDMIKELRDETKTLLASIADWEKSGDSTKAHSSFATLKGILLSLRPKVSKDDLKQVELLIEMIDGRLPRFRSDPSSELSKANAWEVSNQANTLVSLLSQREKDIRWV